MAEITSFHGVHYNPAVVKDITRVVAPPYDMISAADQRALYDRDPLNVVRLILGYQHPTDTADDNRYTRAGADFRKWRADGTLTREAVPSMYRYEQEYSLQRGGSVTRRGFIALTRLEELGSGSIHPHERTMSGPKEDRLRLMLACHANFSQVFAIYDDPAREVDAALDAAGPLPPRADFSDAAGVRHRLIPVPEGKQTRRVAELLKNRNLFIADGHHRYETALTYRRQMRERLGEACPPGVDFIMMYFANMAAPGMTILPFHRLVTLPAGTDPASLVGRLGSLGSLIDLPDAGGAPATLARLQEMMAAAGEGEHRFGILLNGRFHLLVHRRGTPGPAGSENLVAGLDVSILHGQLLPEALGEMEDQAEIAYLTNEEEILRLVNDKRCDLVVFLNPTRVAQVRDIASAGLRMPPKSTNFHPKLISGLVFNSLD